MEESPSVGQPRLPTEMCSTSGVGRPTAVSGSPMLRPIFYVDVPVGAAAAVD